MESFVMPAWMAGIQVCRMRPETSMSARIPALHAGMTQSRSRTKTDRDLHPFYFLRRARRARRKENFTAKNAKGLRFKICGATALPLPLPARRRARSFVLLYIRSLRVLRELRGDEINVIYSASFSTRKPLEVVAKEEADGSD